MKKIGTIPTLLTLGNGLCGFGAIAVASKIDLAKPATEHYFVVSGLLVNGFALSGWLIIAAMLFDALDGYVARMARTASRFGAELDSLCDAISFGLAPAFLLMRMGPWWEPRPFLHQGLACVAALYMVCALLRLARFNVESAADPSANKRFRGLPSPGAAGCLASLAILRGELAGRWATFDLAALQNAIQAAASFGALAVALLMVSRVPYPHVTKQVLRRRRPFRHLVQIIVLAFFVVLVRELALVLIFWVYALGIPARHAVLRSLRPGRVAAPAPGAGEPPGTW